MRKSIPVLVVAAIIFCAGLVASTVFARQKEQQEYILEHEKDIAKQEPGPHKGGGMSTGYNFFSTAPGFKLAFRKRVLHPGSAIGYHLQKEDEIYYIISGTGEMTMNGEKFTVREGDGILTRPGSSHGLKQTGKDDLVVLINYEK
jgi:mannose-6-phosphate isomerase-like protein (cupin superfamily)